MNPKLKLVFLISASAANGILASVIALQTHFIAGVIYWVLSTVVITEITNFIYERKK